ncbi:putative ripening-related protein 1 [Senna tora]|uniref:Putative ripening-related protein 1 n=1 Tax=Senna tora TaxID=362788 RepID=A0A834TVV0_9FABA|nr:putative ripening-related protein 1 [Senna tora]
METTSLSKASSILGGDGGGPSECDNQYHSDDTPVVALSTGWFDHRSRCLNNITISANGKSVVAMVVDECDSTMGCDEDNDYQPPCDNNIVDASKAVWKALGVPQAQWGGLDITWVLPGDCISKIVSFTTPKDACRSTLVSSAFKEAADADAAWERFLPSDCKHIVSQSTSPRLNFLPAKQLYLHLCHHPLLLANGNMCILTLMSSVVDIEILHSWERGTAAQEFFLGQREWQKVLHAWCREPFDYLGNNTYVLELDFCARVQVWSAFRSFALIIQNFMFGNGATIIDIQEPGEIFSQVAKLNYVWWFEVKGSFQTKHLSPNTAYAVFFVFKFEREKRGFKDKYVEFTVNYEGSINGSLKRLILDPPENAVQQREDGWMEVEMGDFFNENEHDDLVQFRIWETDGFYTKEGLVVEGVEFRPKIKE